MNPRTVCFCQAIFSMISASVAPLFRWSRATTWAVLVPWRVPLGFDSPLGGFFDRVALVADLASFGATSGDCTPTVAQIVILLHRAVERRLVGRAPHGLNLDPAQ